MTSARQTALLMTAQVGGTALWLLVFGYAASSGPLSGLPGLSLIALIWFTPLAVHLVGEQIWPVARGQGLRAATGMLGSVGIAIGYFVSIALLRYWEQRWIEEGLAQCMRSGRAVCFGGYIADPPSGPPYSEWALAGAFAALFGLFAMLHLWKSQARRAGS